MEEAKFSTSAAQFFSPTATPQGWFSLKSWNTFFANTFASISQAFWQDPPSLHSHHITPFYQPSKVERLLKRTDGPLQTYPIVPHLEHDTRVLPSYGLTNEGNNCFINTILQIVFVVPELVKHIVFGEGQHPIVRELYQRYRTIHERGTFTTHYPNLSTPLRGIVSQFKGDGQHDAFDFLLRVLIDPLKNPEKNPLFFRFEERTYYHDYKIHREQISDHFEEDGGRVAPAGKGLQSSLQLVLSKDVPYCTMEELIQRSFHEEIPKQKDGPEIEFQRGAHEAPIRLQLAKKHHTISPPPFIFVDFKRHSVASKEFKEGGIFIGQKNTTPIAFSPIFFIPPEFDLEGKGAKYEWVALVNQGGGYGGGHYVADVRTSAGKCYEYSDSSKRELSEQAFVDAGKVCYGGFARRVECKDVPKEMAEHLGKNRVDQEIRRAGYGKPGGEKELEQIALFNKYLSEKEPSLAKLQKAYDQLPPSFHVFVKRFFPEDPRGRLVELKEITKPLLYNLKIESEAVEVEVATHIVAQYEHIRRQNLDLARNHRKQLENQIVIAEHKLAQLKHLATLPPLEAHLAAAILDPGLEKIIAARTLAVLTIEKVQEIKVLRGEKLNEEIRAR